MSDPRHAALDAAIAGDARPGDGPPDLAVTVARARLGACPMPSLSEIEAGGSSLAASLWARAALSALDASGHARATALAATLAQSPRELIESQLGLAWGAHLRGEPALEAARALELQASRARLAHAVIDAATLSASAALFEGDLAHATAQARRASRMARTEGLPNEEYLAHLVLARVRRHGGRPHLSTRIVTAIARVAPARLRGWLTIELLLSGALETARHLHRRGIEGSVDAAPLEALLTQRDAPAGARASASFVGLAPLRAELDVLVAALDPSVPAPPTASAFLAGLTAEVPGALAGLASETAFRVVAWPSGQARRVLVAPGGSLPGVLEIGREAGAKQHRREAALAQLMFAGPLGLAKDELFRRVWGFQFAQHLHQGVLDVLLHRVRAALGEAGDLSRVEGRVQLSLRQPIALVDPSIEAPSEDAVLRALAMRGEAKARELADDLSMPLRSVQQALARLVEDGECLRVGEGQSVSYRLEDTTFREPTRVG